MTNHPFLGHLLALGTWCATSALRADVAVSYEGFAGPPLANLSGANGGTGWTGAWLDESTDCFASVNGPGLTYPNLAVEPGAATADAGDGIYPICQYSRSFAVLPPGTATVYVSFLLRDDLGSGIWGGLSFGSYPYEMQVGVPAGMYAFGLMLSEGLGDISNAPLMTGDTYLIVVRIKKNPSGNNVTYSLYLNPTVGSSEPSFPLAAYTGGPVGLPTSLRIDNGGGFTTDEIRVGLSWDSVLPFEPPCLADITHDGVVNGADVATVLGQWGTVGSADLDASGLVDGADLAIVLGEWGACP